MHALDPVAGRESCARSRPVAGVDAVGSLVASRDVRTKCKENRAKSMKFRMTVMTLLVSGLSPRLLLAGVPCFVGVATAGAQVTLVTNFEEETKLKGRMTPLEDHLYGGRRQRRSGRLRLYWTI